MPERSGGPQAPKIGGRPARSVPGPARVAPLLVLLLVSAGPAPAAAAHGPLAPCAFTVGVTATPLSGPAPLLVRFNATVSSGTPDFFNWSFGDGSIWNNSSATGSTPLHRYSTSATYPVTVTAGESGCEVAARTNVTVFPGPITVIVRAHPASGVAPLNVTFNASVSGGTGTYATAVWSFGDGGVGSGLNLVYTYSRAGAFTAVLNVTDSAGHWSEATTNVTVGVAAPPPNSLSPWIPVLIVLLGLGATVGILLVGFRRLSLTSRGSDRPNGALPPQGAIGGRSPVGPPTPHRGGPDSVHSPAGSPEPPSVAAPPIPAPSSVGGPGETTNRRRETLQLSERVINHIGRQGLLRPDELAPLALTQGGMADALGCRQNSLTNVLRRLTAAGIVNQELRHVRRHSRRLRVYSLTARGEALYRELRTRPRGIADDRGPSTDAKA